MKQFRKYSQKHHQVLLDEAYLFAYSLSDGFSERLLSADFLIDYDYNYILQLKAFQHQNITKNHSDFFIEKGQLSPDILHQIEDFLSSDYQTLELNYNYQTFDITDIGSQHFFINLDTLTQSIHISEGLPIEYFKTKIEQKLFHLNEYLKKIIEQKYENWLQ